MYITASARRRLLAIPQNTRIHKKEEELWKPFPNIMFRRRTPCARAHRRNFPLGYGLLTSVLPTPAPSQLCKASGYYGFVPVTVAGPFWILTRFPFAGGTPYKIVGKVYITIKTLSSLFPIFIN
jgi:hypothetical protein